MNISVITVCYNSAKVVRGCLSSVAAQSNCNIEHVIIDGGSSDGTLEILQAHRSNIAMLVSEPDNGIYDALNKGFALSTGDIIGILHSDDRFYDSTVLERVTEAFGDPSVDYVYGDIEMVHSDGSVARFWKTGEFRDGRITGSQIPHPALFLSRRLVEQLKPVFDSSYRISADLKQQLIFANVLRAKGAYIPTPLVRMQIGGTSTASLSSIFLGWKESRRAWTEVHGSGGIFFVVKKVLSKFPGIRFS
jgi:glycosyltransferase involved in cell wall biosynthesis